MRTGTGDKPNGIIAVLGVLPKLNVSVIEDVLVGVHVVERLWGQNHAHIIPSVEERDHLGEEINVCNLQSQQHISNSASCKQMHSSIAATAGHMRACSKGLLCAHCFLFTLLIPRTALIGAHASHSRIPEVYNVLHNECTCKQKYKQPAMSFQSRSKQ